MKSTKIYMDNCCFNRPFDNQSSETISLETKAKLFVQEKIRNGEITLIWSFMLTYENSENPFDERRDAIIQWKELSTQNLDPDNDIKELAIKYQNDLKLKPKDAIHLACAVHSGCDYLLTTDRQFVNNSVSLNRIKVLNPLDFIRIWEEK